MPTAPCISSDPRNISKKDKELYKKLPRKVWSSFKRQLQDPALEAERITLTDEQNR
jgi:hypothetical protein